MAPRPPNARSAPGNPWRSSMTRMELGFGLPLAGAWATPQALVTVARRAEALGYHAAWTFQRLFYPVAPREEYYGASGGPWPAAFASRFPIVCRGSYNLTAEPLGTPRRALWGSAAQIREDLGRYAEAGVTQMFLEPNFQPGGAQLDRVLSQMETLAP